MDWSRFENMDPNLLVGVVNTSIRDHHGTLEELCEAEGIDQEALKQRLASEDYEYIEDAHQFR